MTDKTSVAILKLVIQKKGMASLTVIGSSMLPVLKDGETINIRQDEYKIGDIIVFDYPGEGLLIHRVISIVNGVYICKGDNAVRTEPVMKRKIIGRMISDND